MTTGTAVVPFRGRDYTFEGDDFMRWVRLLEDVGRGEITGEDASRLMVLGDLTGWIVDGADTVVVARTAAEARAWYLDQESVDFETVYDLGEIEPADWMMRIHDEDLARVDRPTDLVDVVLHQKQTRPDEIPFVACSSEY